jgi:hypothetical protein
MDQLKKETIHSTLENKTEKCAPGGTFQSSGVTEVWRASSRVGAADFQVQVQVY